MLGGPLPPKESVGRFNKLMKSNQFALWPLAFRPFALCRPDRWVGSNLLKTLVVLLWFTLIVVGVRGQGFTDNGTPVANNPVALAAQQHPEGFWIYASFSDIGEPYICGLLTWAGPCPTNMSGPYLQNYTNEFMVPQYGRTLRDPSICIYSNFFLLTYNLGEVDDQSTNGTPFCWSKDGFNWHLASVGTWDSWGPEWFIDATNGLHELLYRPAHDGGNSICDILFTVTNGVPYLQTVNKRGLTLINGSGIGGGEGPTSGSDPIMIYTNGLYYYFDTQAEYVSRYYDHDFTKISDEPMSGEGSDVFRYGGLWYWVKSNDNPYQYATSLDLTNWTTQGSFTGIPNAGVYTNLPFPGQLEQGDYLFVNSAAISSFGLVPTLHISVSQGNAWLTWTGNPLVKLQTSPSLNPALWVDVPNTLGASSATVPLNGMAFFRLSQ